MSWYWRLIGSRGFESLFIVIRDSVINFVGKMEYGGIWWYYCGVFWNIDQKNWITLEDFYGSWKLTGS